MRPTRLWLLPVVAVVAGVVAYLLTVNYYANWPSPPSYAPIWLLLLAIAEAYTAVQTRARLAGGRGTKPIHPLVAARLAALAKATSPVAAVIAGAYAGFLVHVARVSSTQARHDTRTAAIGVACSVLLALSALLLERVCRVKPPPDDGGAAA